MYHLPCYACGATVGSKNGHCIMCGAGANAITAEDQRSELQKQLSESVRFGTTEEQEQAQERLEAFDR